LQSNFFGLCIKFRSLAVLRASLLLLEEGGIVPLLGRNHVENNPGSLSAASVSLGIPSGPASDGSKRRGSSGFDEALGAHPQRGRLAVLRPSRSRGEDLPTADLRVRAYAQSRTERCGGWEAREVRADFGRDHLGRKRVDTRNLRQHKTIKHRDGMYFEGDITTNGIESAFSLLKRGIYYQASIDSEVFELSENNANSPSLL
jgi:hypothetical protein